MSKSFSTNIEKLYDNRQKITFQPDSDVNPSRIAPREDIFPLFFPIKRHRAQFLYGTINFHFVPKQRLSFEKMI